MPELNALQSACDAAISIGVEGIEVNQGTDVAAGINSQRIGDRSAAAIHHARSFLTGGVDEIAVFIGGIVRTIYIAVAQRKLQIRRNFAAPLGDAVLFRLLNRFVNQSDGFRIGLGDNQ